MEPESDSITLYGDFPRQIVALKASNLILVTTFGQTDDGEDVLIPLLDFQLFGSRQDPDEAEQETKQLYSAMLSMESAAYLLRDMSGDMARAIRLLNFQCKGGVTPDKERLRFSGASLRRAATELEEAAGRIDEIIGEDLEE